jgi:predicted signal transduction protein with EAL and GGDEF domain
VNYHRNQHPYWIHIDAQPIFNEVGELTHYIGIYEDITASKQSQQRIERLAYSDNLTGLGNRYAFIRALEARFGESGQPAISLPMGRTVTGLPAGVQLVAAYGRDDVLLRVAAQLETAAPWKGFTPTALG